MEKTNQQIDSLGLLCIFLALFICKFYTIVGSLFFILGKKRMNEFMLYYTEPFLQQSKMLMTSETSAASLVGDDLIIKRGASFSVTLSHSVLRTWCLEVVDFLVFKNHSVSAFSGFLSQNHFRFPRLPHMKKKGWIQTRLSLSLLLVVREKKGQGFKPVVTVICGKFTHFHGPLSVLFSANHREPAACYHSLCTIISTAPYRKLHCRSHEYLSL